MVEKITKEQIARLTDQEKEWLILEQQRILIAQKKMAPAFPNVLQLMDFRVESIEPLPVIKKMLDEMIKDHHDFSVWRRTQLMMKNEVVKSYIG